ncbi:hypothetical protein GZH47_09165 [Paenibacillus rhizovicinus]|uniref:Uncharacterized protein n=1 Tax=Paenibacillus rhizovicinus TaxID=2704463 RepID=A0A6C0NXN3_9BACL|nr:hypothetical protein [Paenibacillus rhizovicinus]QHW31004.1 hypothetical protein GZH47_09165 [Paenibacillus rhizovicinus]
MDLEFESRRHFIYELGFVSYANKMLKTRYSTYVYDEQIESWTGDKIGKAAVARIKASGVPIDRAAGSLLAECKRLSINTVYTWGSQDKRELEIVLGGSSILGSMDFVDYRDEFKRFMGEAGANALSLKAAFQLCYPNHPYQVALHRAAYDAYVLAQIVYFVRTFPASVYRTEDR